MIKQARAIMQKIATVSGKGAGQINVSGHTDDVPLIFGGQYRDNWDLAAARASSVVQELSKSGTIPSDKLRAISFGETKPIEQQELILEILGSIRKYIINTTFKKYRINRYIVLLLLLIRKKIDNINKFYYYYYYYTLQF